MLLDKIFLGAHTKDNSLILGSYHLEIPDICSLINKIFANKRMATNIKLNFSTPQKFFYMSRFSKQQVTLKSRWRIDVDAGLVFILNIDTRSQFQEKQKVVRGEKGSQQRKNRQGENQLETFYCRSQRKQTPQCISS